MDFLICITFYYRKWRLPLLRRILAEQSTFAERATAIIVSNAAPGQETDSLETIARSLSGPTFNIKPFLVSELAHPFLLTWSHKEILETEFLCSQRYSHFLYVEDDLLVTRRNINYWHWARAKLRPSGLIPSFLRVEQKGHRLTWTSTDVCEPVRLERTPGVKLSWNLSFINLPNPYQGMYLFDRELAEEHRAGASWNQEFGCWWGIRERAAAGQTFVNIPPGFVARNAVPVSRLTGRIPTCCWVHHLPNNYANDPASGHGKFAVNHLIKRQLLPPSLRVPKPVRSGTLSESFGD